MFNIDANIVRVSFTHWLSQMFGCMKDLIFLYMRGSSVNGW